MSGVRGEGQGCSCPALKPFDARRSMAHYLHFTDFNYPRMERWKGRVAIVSGASAGIGYELSKRLVHLGVVVVGCARNIAAIEVRKLRANRSGVLL